MEELGESQLAFGVTDTQQMRRLHTRSTLGGFTGGLCVFA